MMKDLRVVARVMLMLAGTLAVAQEPATSEVPRVVEVTPKEVTAEVGQKLTFKAVAKNAAGEVIPGTPSLWFTAPFDLAGAEKGVVTVYQPGEIRVGAVINGKRAMPRSACRPRRLPPSTSQRPKLWWSAVRKFSQRPREMLEGILSKTRPSPGCPRRLPSRASTRQAWRRVFVQDKRKFGQVPGSQAAASALRL